MTGAGTIVDATTITATSPVTPIFATLPSSNNRPYRMAYMTNEGQLTQNVDYYRTLPQQSSRTRNPSPEPIYETNNLPMQTSVRRIDRSGLLEIVEPEPQSLNLRNRHSRSPDATGHLATLPRRIDRSGLLEAVPELPDQVWKSEDLPDNSIGSSRDESAKLEHKLTGGVETDLQRQKADIRRSQTSPRSSRAPSDTTCFQSLMKRSSMEISSPQDNSTEARSKSTESRNKVSSPNNLSSVTSPYLRRYPGDNPTSSLERPTPVTPSDEARSRNNSFACLSTPSNNQFLPIDTLPSRGRQTYVDLTGSTYTRSIPMTNSPLGSTRTGLDTTHKILSEIDNSLRQTHSQQQQQPDCLGKLSPRSRGERQSPLTMSSSIPDVIEAHGSRTQNRGDNGMEKSPDCERVEAEGCEQRTNIDDTTEETRVSFKGSKKMIHNDNIQTLRVIILSEQLWRLDDRRRRHLRTNDHPVNRDNRELFSYDDVDDDSASTSYNSLWLNRAKGQDDFNSSKQYERLRFIRARSRLGTCILNRLTRVLCTENANEHVV